MVQHNVIGFGEQGGVTLREKKKITGWLVKRSLKPNRVLFFTAFEIAQKRQTRRYYFSYMTCSLECISVIRSHY